MTRPMTYSRLPEPAYTNSSLLCRMCNESYSANRGDYWDRLDEPMLCRRCLEPLKLVRKVVRYVQVRPLP